MRIQPLHLVLLQAGVWQFRCNSGAKSFNENSWLQLRVQKSNMVSECTVQKTTQTRRDRHRSLGDSRELRKRKIHAHESCNGPDYRGNIAFATGLQARTPFCRYSMYRVHWQLHSTTALGNDLGLMQYCTGVFFEFFILKWSPRGYAMAVSGYLTTLLVGRRRFLHASNGPIFFRVHLTNQKRAP